MSWCMDRNCEVSRYLSIAFSSVQKLLPIANGNLFVEIKMKLFPHDIVTNRHTVFGLCEQETDSRMDQSMKRQYLGGSGLIFVSEHFVLRRGREWMFWAKLRCWSTMQIFRTWLILCLSPVWSRPLNSETPRVRWTMKYICSNSQGGNSFSVQRYFWFVSWGWLLLFWGAIEAAKSTSCRRIRLCNDWLLIYAVH